jgi:hypothetical protein
MKKTILISALLLGAASMNAQTTYQTTTNHAVCKSFPNMPANAVPVWPKGTYTPLEDPACPPCYEYTSKHGTRRMECPYLRFPPEHSTSTTVNNEVTEQTTTDYAPVNAGRSMDVQSNRTYTGNYPAVCKSFPDMPRNAHPVWPKGTYTPLEDPSCPPCYEYVSKHGTLRMECPYLRFPPEHTRQ